MKFFNRHQGFRLMFDVRSSQMIGNPEIITLWQTEMVTFQGIAVALPQSDTVRYHVTRAHGSQYAQLEVRL